MGDPTENSPLVRVYHEDKLLSDRIDSYLAANAFLVIAFATVFLTSAVSLWAAIIVQTSIVLLGLFLAFFYISIGSRNRIAIEFWRECEQAGLHSVNDKHLFTYFERGQVHLPGGIIKSYPRGKSNAEEGSVRASVPWKWDWVGSPNHVIGVWVPRGIATFWVVLSSTISYGATTSIEGHPLPVTPLLFAPMLVVAILLFIAWAPPKGHPKWVKTDDQTLLAVLGRGIQKVGENWVPTEDLEVFIRDQKGKPVHSPTRLAVDDSNENCLIGGGELNVHAAALLLSRTKMGCVLGYAPPASYLRNPQVEGPSESLPMGELLRSLVPNAEVIDWNDGQGSEESNTDLEVGNVMKLASRIGVKEVRFLTISPHVPRVTIIAQKTKEDLKLRVDFTIESSESILSDLEPECRDRIAHIQQSKAYRRTVFAEYEGVKKLLGI